ncbi:MULTISPECIES: SDR family oxidoreductase [Deinococcus]|uniref:3-oxoacyl-[acyl-carrier protein] reductase n=1 Tax=Deinococcus marmoris TaxID=249408 RepID=A0A1U7NTF4_9DEIO|nr:SDR family oxidoreductase [Deinococcus marmoris]OLV16196.1 3-oxoacyl-[acyl-carrier protein] reductase [Deinococcus marmoris]
MTRSKKPRIVVVTGASAGAGRAVAVAFGKRGDTVALIARGRAGLEGAKIEVESAGGKALVVQCDVADADAVEAAAERIETELGPIDVWVNVAMTGVFSYVKDMKPEEYKRVTDVNYLGFVYGTLSALKRMLPRDSGRIIQFGSALAYRGIPLQSAYCGSKHAIQGFCDSLRAELLSENSKVTVSMVQMPAINTPQFDWLRTRMPRKAQPVPPIYQPEIPAAAILYAADTGRRELLVGFPTWVAVWGNNFLPAVGDWYLAKTCINGQMTDQAQPKDAPDNMFHPLDDEKDWGMHGRFDDRARTTSWELPLDEHRTLFAGALAVAVAGVWGVSRALRR